MKKLPVGTLTMLQPSTLIGVEAEKLNEAFDCLHKEAGKAWLDTKSILFHHALEYHNMLSNFLKESKEAIEALHDHIWTVIVKVMEDAGKPMANGLGITMCLVDMFSHHPDTLGFPLIYTRTHQLCARGLCCPALVQDRCFGSHAHATTAKGSEGVGCTV